MAYEPPKPSHLPPSVPKLPPTQGGRAYPPSGAREPMRGLQDLDGFQPRVVFRPRARTSRWGLWAPIVLFAAGMALGTGALWHWVTPVAPSLAGPGSPSAPGGSGPQAATAGPLGKQAPYAPPPPSAPSASLLFTADGPIGAPEIFWLDNPSRLVVDLMGVKPAAAAPVVAAHHPGVRRIRLGAHSDRTRYVIEMAQTSRPEVHTRVEGRALAVTLRFVETDRVQTD